MTRREYLTEQYEDALFALLMEPVAISEGIKAEEENERLRNDAAAAVPASLRNKCSKTIKKHYAKREMRKNGRTASRLIARVAIVAMILVLLMTTAFALSPTLRAKAMNWLVESFADHTEISSVPANGSDNLKMDIESAIPEGFTLVEERTENAYRYIVYENQDTAARLTIKMTDSSVGPVAFDTEEAEVEHINLLGEDVIIVEKDTYVQALSRGNGSEAIIINGENVDRETVVSVVTALLDEK